MTFDYPRYLAAKTTADDRALNRHVLAELRRLMPVGAPRVVEVGAGLGTMVARLMDWGVVGAALDGKRLLDHPFYRRWEAGEVTLGELADYASQYRHFESYLPNFLGELLTLSRKAESGT